ncbi:MAG TPA: four helix bundle protein [Saprospiraceae bacterium]|nr:four helix bundle protein [Saprospiraceae bacterium]
MHQFSFERLNVWQRGRELCKLIYQISKGFTADERFGATQQIRRAALSVTCNLAEGSSRHKGVEKARYTEIAYGSLMEVLNLLIMGVDLEFIEEGTLNEIRPLIEEISNKLNKLRESQLKETK